ncbi:MAG: hypothetical protein ACI9FZ_000045 [Bacteroidia bacterium]|jgi:hypothetical protein
MYTQLFIASLLCGFSIASFAATNFISDQLPTGKTLADYGLGARPTGGSEHAVRLVELATVPGAGSVQQIVSRNDKLYIVLREGRIWEYDLQGNVTAEPLLDLTVLRSGFLDAGGWFPSRGLRSLAFHPDYETNGLVYTMQKEASDGSTPDYGTVDHYTEFVCCEWDFNNLVDGAPTFRLLFRIRFEHDYHVAQYLMFNPTAMPGSADYGMLYVAFGDNGIRTGGQSYENKIRELNDVSNVTQNFNSVQGGVIRIDPLNPSDRTNEELTLEGLKRSPNGNFSIPLDNPFIGLAGHKEELFAKGFRNPLTLSFSPEGAPVVGEAGEQSMEEINVLTSGGNYGWPNREGTFLVAWADQINGSPLGSDESMVWMPSGKENDPAINYYVRDKDQNNLNQLMLARSGVHDDGLDYPVFQFSHEGNNSNGALNGLSAVVGGDYYSGFWAEELEGLYLFGNLSTDQIFYGASAALDSGLENVAMNELPLIDAAGVSTTLAIIVGNNRANMRFGKDSYGNLYLASKTNKKLYRLQGTPELKLTASGAVTVAELTGQYFEFTLERPPSDSSITYTLEISEDLNVGFVQANQSNYEVVSIQPLLNGKERVRYRYLVAMDNSVPRFFRINW